MELTGEHSNPKEDEKISDVGQRLKKQEILIDGNPYTLSDYICYLTGTVGNGKNV